MNAWLWAAIGWGLAALFIWGMIHHLKTKALLRDRLIDMIGPEICARELRKKYNERFATDVSIALYHMVLTDLKNEGLITDRHEEGSDGCGLRRFVAAVEDM